MVLLLNNLIKNTITENDKPRSLEVALIKKNLKKERICFLGFYKQYSYYLFSLCLLRFLSRNGARAAARLSEKVRYSVRSAAIYLQRIKSDHVTMH